MTDPIRLVDLTPDNEAKFARRYVGCLVLTQDNKILLQQRPVHWRTHPGCLATFGGGIESGETPMEALVRELHEELGAKVIPSDVVSLGTVTEFITNYSELIYTFFWHDKHGTITSCYECEAKHYDTVDEIFAHPKVMDDVRWLLKVCQNRGLLITTKIATALIAEQFPQFSHLPIKPVDHGGNDNRTFHLGSEMSIRLPSAQDYARQVQKEQIWLPKLASHLPLPIPAPIAMGMPSEVYPWNWSIYKWLEGESANSLALSDAHLETIAAQLAQFLSDFHKFDAAGAPAPGLHNWWRAAHTSVYDTETRQLIEKLKDFVDADNASSLWQRAINSRWNKDPVWVHGDVASGNLLIKDNRLAAVIDFGCMGIGDPACDLTIAWTFFSGKSREIFKSKMHLDEETWARARGWAMWKALYEIWVLDEEDKSGTLLAQQLQIIDDVIEEDKSNKGATKQDITAIIKWTKESLLSKEYLVNAPSELILTTPWSHVIRFSTSKGFVYLKQAPHAISAEPKIFQLLSDHFQANVPSVIAINDEHHCFLTKDGGQNLRAYLKTDFQPNLLCQAIKEYAAMQRSTEDNLESFFSLGVPDWRISKLPKLYDHIINQETLLKEDGLTDNELQILHDLSSQFSAQCEILSQYQIPETIAIYDINTNNVLIDTNTKKITFIDLGEAVITHPFFSLHTYLHQATLHHPVKELDQVYYQLQDACFENWLGLATKDKLLEAFKLAKKFWPIYSALSMCRLINIIGLQAFKTFYANRPNRIANYFKEYIQSFDQYK